MKPFLDNIMSIFEEYGAFKHVHADRYNLALKRPACASTKSLVKIFVASISEN